MHIEIDVWELAFLIFVLYAVKWLFRLLILIFISKIIAGVKRKGEERLNEIKRQFSTGTNKQGSESN